MPEMLASKYARIAAIKIVDRVTSRLAERLPAPKPPVLWIKKNPIHRSIP